MFLPGDEIKFDGSTGVVTSRPSVHEVEVEVGGVRRVLPEHGIARVPLPPPSSSRARRYSLSPPPLDMPSRETIERLHDVYLQMTLDWRGHWRGGREWGKLRAGWATSESSFRLKLLPTEGFYFSDMTGQTAEAILQAWETKTPLKDFTPFFAGSNEFHLHCPYCTTEAHRFETNGLVVRPVDRCTQPTGLVTRWTMNFPSGKILIANDLRSLCRIPMDRDINQTLNVHLSILDYAEAGLALGLGIGNTCPGVYRMANGSYEIGNKRRVPKGGEKVASVITDLWAYSIIDLEEARRRAEFYKVDFDALLKKWTVHVVDVERGKYQFEHYHNKGQARMAKFRRIGDADAVTDSFLAREREFYLDITQAYQYRKGMVDDPERFLASRWAGHHFGYILLDEFRGCIPDRDWHPNGHRHRYPHSALGLPPFPIPRIRAQLSSWEPLKESVLSTALYGPGLWGGETPLNDSYAVAAAYLLEAYISFGLKSEIRGYATPEEDGVAKTRKEMRAASEIWPDLIAKYPHVREYLSDFAEWMEDREAVSRWIDEFPLELEPKWTFPPESESARFKRILQTTRDPEVILSSGARGHVIRVDDQEDIAEVRTDLGVEFASLSTLKLSEEEDQRRQEREKFLQEARTARFAFSSRRAQP